MDLDDFFEPEVGIAVLVTAAIATPPVRRALRQGAVYGLAGLMMAGDKLASAARTVSERAQSMAQPSTQEAASQPTAQTQGAPA